MTTYTLRKRRFVNLLAVIWLPLAFAMTGCEEKGDLDIITPLPIVSTVAVFADTTVDFGALHTFALADTVVHLNPLTGTPLPVSRAYDQDVINSVRANFRARGYVEDLNADSVPPKFVVLISATATQNRVAWVNYPWYSTWGFFLAFPPFTGLDNAWGIVYPWAPNVAVTLHPRGTLIVDLIPTLQVNPLKAGKTVNAAWSGVATSALTGDRSAAQLDAAIDQMFLLSPYLRSDSLIVTPL